MNILYINSPLESSQLKDKFIEILQIDLNLLLVIFALLCYAIFFITGKHIISTQRLKDIKKLPFGLSRDSLIYRYTVRLINIWGTTSLFWTYFVLVSCLFFISVSIQSHIFLLGKLKFI